MMIITVPPHDDDDDVNACIIKLCVRVYSFEGFDIYLAGGGSRVLEGVYVLMKHKIIHFSQK